MSTQQEYPPAPYQASYTGILSINDYENDPEDQPVGQEQLPFDEIEQILSDPASVVSRREAVLVMAVNYLQERCSELTNNNNYLHLRHQDLLEEIAFLAEVEISQETAHGFLEVMQKEIESYKMEFHHYRERYLALKKGMLDENARLNARIGELEMLLTDSDAERQALEEERDQMLTSNQQLLDINAQLNERMEDLEQELSTLREESKYYQSSSRSYGSRKLDGEIQFELQSLIEKLMVELQSERSQKLKLSSEYKLLQKQLMHLEKEVTERNGKIYQLQMNSLKNNRLSPQSKVDRPRQIYETTKNHKPSYEYNKTQRQRTLNQTSKHDSVRRQKEGSSFKTFSLMTLLNQNVEFSKKTRLIIALKVIQFYLRKIKKGEFTTQMLQNLLVYNYSALYPQACIIRKDKSVTSKEGECSQERLIWNLGFILDNLVNQAEDESEQKTKAELEMVNLINNILEENSCSLKDVDELKLLAQEAVRLKR